METMVCNVCGGSCQSFLEFDAVPPMQNRFCSTAAQAREFPLTSVRYAWCGECQHISIAKARPVKFDAQYNNDQTSSRVAVAHYQNVVAEIENVLPNREAKIVEIGCGRGELLLLLKERGYSNLLGYDPSAPSELGQIVRNDYWVPSEKSEIDLLVLRHTLEEIPDLEGFMHDIEVSLSETGFVYCEITNVSRMMRKRDAFSLYPECSNLFTASSLARLFGRHGVSIERVVGYHEDEWLGVWGRKFTGALRLLDGQNFLEGVIQQIDQLPKPVVLWGAGGRGGNILSFCGANLATVPFVVDSNEAKQGLFIPPYGQEIIAPDRLSEIAPKTILVSSAKYKDEIIAIAPPGCLVLSVGELILATQH